MIARSRRAAGLVLAACWLASAAATARAEPFLLASGATWTQGALPWGLLPDGSALDLGAMARATDGLLLASEPLVAIDLGAGVAFADAAGSLRSARGFADDTTGLELFTRAAGRFLPFSPQDDLLEALATLGAVAFRARCPRGVIGCPLSLAPPAIDPSRIFVDGFETGDPTHWSNF